MKNKEEIVKGIVQDVYTIICDEIGELYVHRQVSQYIDKKYPDKNEMEKEQDTNDFYDSIRTGLIWRLQHTSQFISSH